MAGISYITHRQTTARFHNPLKDGQLDEQAIEVRLDPLTGQQSVFNVALEDKASILFPDTDFAYLEKRAEETRESCFLCDEKWRKTTPRYTSDLFPEGRLVYGDAVLFPNLFPLAGFHAVVMVGAKHYRPLDDIPVSLLKEAFSVSLEFIRRCHEASPETIYFTINANYLFPAGASVIHPHLQLLGSPFPGTYHKLLLDRSLAYFQENGSCYWLDLLDAEAEAGSRLIGAVGPSTWLAPFSPGGANEIDAVWPEASHFLEWGEEEVNAMAEGVASVLRAYHELKLSTFNLSCFSGPVDRKSPEFRCILKLVNRQNAAPHYRTDDYYFQKLLKNEIMVRRPESLAPFMRNHFRWQESISKV